MKRLYFAIQAALLIPLLGGCSLWNSGTPEEYQVPSGHYQLIADFSNGALDGSLEFLNAPIESPFYDAEAGAYVFTQEATEAAAMEIAALLSEWTGLDFTLNSVRMVENGLLVDWSKDSTLLAGLGEKAQKEGFHFYDAASLNWFMLDSLAFSLNNNLQVSFVYYCTDGEALDLEGMTAEGQTLLPVDEPYYSSYYYVSQSVGQEEEG